MSRKNKKQSALPVHHPKTFGEYQQLHSELQSRRFVPIDALKPGPVKTLTLGDRDPSNKEVTEMAASMGCGAWSNGPLRNVAWSFDSRDNAVHAVSDKDGKPMGLGYVDWGPGNSTPSVIPPLAMSLPYTASPLRYIADLTAGLGPKLMYQFDDDTMCEYRKAGYRILERIEALKKNEPEPDFGGELTHEPRTGAIVNIGDLAPEDRPDPILKGLGLDYWRDAYREWERTWLGYEDIYDLGGGTQISDHVPGAKEFLEENNLNLHLSQCEQDDVMLDIYFPTVGFHHKGFRRLWRPVINRVGFLPAHSTRLERMDSNRFIHHCYLSDQWRTLGGARSVSATDPELTKITMYQAAMPQNLLHELRYIVEDNQKKGINSRPMWVVCPTFYPSGQKPYYPQPAWWSIFSSKAFDFASTILYDKYKARENSTSWGKIFYISLDYIDRVIADNGLEGKPDEIEKFIEGLEQSMEDFLQQRENHGKMMRQWMWGEGSNKTFNVEIVDVKETTQDAVKAGKEELELSTSPIFLALGVDPRLVGVPMVAASNGGTALREMQLLKQQQLNVKQRLYLNFLNSIVKFNQWDEHAQFVIQQQTLTTLDNSKTGIVETIAGEGA